MSNNQPPPYNPFMFPFPFPYPPPPFMNPMMPPQPRNSSSSMISDMNSMQRPFHMPPFGYPPFPMVYHPNLQNFFPFYEPKAQPKITSYSEHAGNSKEPIQQSKKIKACEASVGEKQQGSYIVLSDDEEIYQVKKKTPFVQKQSLEYHPDQQIDLSYKPRLRRPVRKGVSQAKQDPFVLKVRIQQKKIELTHQQKKSKIQRMMKKQKKIIAQMAIQNQNQSFSQSSRNKFLTAKDGKGKIMIGDLFQANLPIFLPRNEILTVWIDQRKHGLLSRFVKLRKKHYQ